MEPQSPYLQHILDRISSSLVFLESQQLLSNADLQLIQSKLPSASQQQQHQQLAPAPLHHQLSGLSVASSGAGSAYSGAPSMEGRTCRALWDYVQVQPDDLPFRQGDTINVEECMNADWWCGSCNGRSGIFPSNHVEIYNLPQAYPLPASDTASYASSLHSYPQSPAHSFISPSHPSPPPSTHSQPYQPYTPQLPSAKQPFQPSPPAQAAAGPPPIPPKNKFGKLGGKLGGRMAQGFAGGVGFGTASAVIHSIL